MATIPTGWYAANGYFSAVIFLLREPDHTLAGPVDFSAETEITLDSALRARPVRGKGQAHLSSVSP